MEDARRYLIDMVDPTIGDFENDPRSARRALLACIALFHVIDYFAYPKASQTMREEFCKNDDFLLIDRIANAAKHVVSGHPQSPKKPPLDAREVIDRPPAFSGVAKAGLTRSGDRKGGVTLLEDTTVDVFMVLKRARSFVERLVPL